MVTWFTFVSVFVHPVCVCVCVVVAVGGRGSICRNVAEIIRSGEKILLLSSEPGKEVSTLAQIWENDQLGHPVIFTFILCGIDHDSVMADRT